MFDKGHNPHQEKTYHITKQASFLAKELKSLLNKYQANGISYNPDMKNATVSFKNGWIITVPIKKGE